MSGDSPASSFTPSVPSAHGWQALLELGYERRGERTVPSLRRHLGPLRIQKHFEPEPALCEHVIVHPPAGIVGGDRLAIDVSVGAHAMTRLTTPGATRWYRSAGALATSQLTARVGQGAFLEWLPQEQIVFDGALAQSTLSFELAPDASLIAWDVTVLGRKAGDQPFMHGSWRTRLDVTRADQLVWSDRALTLANDPLRASPLGWGGYDVLATFLATGPKQLTAILPAARAIPVAGQVGITDVMSPATSNSRAGSIFSARALTHSVAPAAAWLAALWALVRPALIGREAHPSRIWRT